LQKHAFKPVTLAICNVSRADAKSHWLVGFPAQMRNHIGWWVSRAGAKSHWLVVRKKQAIIAHMRNIECRG
jgi:hypothetical protein